MKTSFIKQTKIENSIEHEMVMTTPVMNGRTLQLNMNNENPMFSPAFNLTPKLNHISVNKDAEIKKVLNSIKGMIGVNSKNMNKEAFQNGSNDKKEKVPEEIKNNEIIQQAAKVVVDNNKIEKLKRSMEKSEKFSESTPKKDLNYRSPKKVLIDSGQKTSTIDFELEMENKDKPVSLTSCYSYTEFIRSKTLNSNTWYGDYHNKIVKPKKAFSNSSSTSNLQKVELDQLKKDTHSSRSKFENKFEEKKTVEPPVKKEGGKVMNIKSLLKNLE